MKVSWNQNIFPGLIRRHSAKVYGKGDSRGALDRRTVDPINGFYPGSIVA